MAKSIENNHTGNIVLFLYPTPNSRMLLSVLYKNVGFKNWVNEKMIIKITIDTKVTFFPIMFLNIYYNNKELLIIYYFTLINILRC